MSKFIVTRLADSQIVYRYENETKIIWDQFPETEHAYTIDASPTEPVVLPSVFNGRRLLTHLEFRSLLHTEEQELIDEFTATFEGNIALSSAVKRRIRTMMKKYGEATIIDLDDPDNEAGLGLYVSLGAMAFYRIAEVLNG